MINNAEGEDGVPSVLRYLDSDNAGQAAGPVAHLNLAGLDAAGRARATQILGALAKNVVLRNPEVDAPVCLQVSGGQPATAVEALAASGFFPEGLVVVNVGNFF